MGVDDEQGLELEALKMEAAEELLEMNTFRAFFISKKQNWDHDKTADFMDYLGVSGPAIEMLLADPDQRRLVQNLLYRVVLRMALNIDRFGNEASQNDAAELLFAKGNVSFEDKFESLSGTEIVLRDLTSLVRTMAYMYETGTGKDGVEFIQKQLLFEVAHEFILLGQDVPDEIWQTLSDEEREDLEFEISKSMENLDRSFTDMESKVRDKLIQQEVEKGIPIPEAKKIVDEKIKINLSWLSEGMKEAEQFNKKNLPKLLSEYSDLRNLANELLDTRDGELPV